jgi:hypothetical protein
MASHPSSGKAGDEVGCVVQLPLTDEERIEYQKAAERCGQSLAEWIRQRLTEAAKREAKEA